MFSLIVSGDFSGQDWGSITVYRILEYTPEHIRTGLFDGDELNTALCTQFPTVLMDEGVEDQIVRIGWVSRIEQRGDNYQFHYRIDPDFRAMTNAEIFEMAPKLGIEPFEFSRNHWAVKGADLFQTLYRSTSSRIQLPDIFNFAEKPIKKGRVSVMMPFDEDLDSVYNAVKNSLGERGYDCMRADEFWKNPQVMQDIIELIYTSEFVICDLSKMNPNVFYEAGIAHALGKKVLLTTQSMDDISFDLKSLRCIIYKNDQDGIVNLCRRIVARINSLT